MNHSKFFSLSETWEKSPKIIHFSFLATPNWTDLHKQHRNIEVYFLYLLWKTLYEKNLQRAFNSYSHVNRSSILDSRILKWKFTKMDPCFFAKTEFYWSLSSFFSATFSRRKCTVQNIMSAHHLYNPPFGAFSRQSYHLSPFYGQTIMACKIFIFYHNFGPWNLLR